MKKSLLILSTLIITSGQIFAATGIKVINETGLKIDANIDNFTGPEWVTIEKNQKDLTFLPSKSGNRKIRWKESTKDKYNQIVYETKEAYSLPDTITIKNAGTKYDITSGITKKTVKDITPNSIGGKTTKKGSQENPNEQKNILNAIKNIGAIIKNTIEDASTALEEFADEIIYGKGKVMTGVQAKVTRESLEKMRTTLEGHRMEANRKISEAINSTNETIKAELNILKKNLENIKNADKKIYDKIQKLEKDYPSTKRSQTSSTKSNTTQELQDKIAEYNTKIEAINAARIKENKPKKYSLWLYTYTRLKNEAENALKK